MGWWFWKLQYNDTNQYSIALHLYCVFHLYSIWNYGKLKMHAVKKIFGGIPFASILKKSLSGIMAMYSILNNTSMASSHSLKASARNPSITSWSRWNNGRAIISMCHFFRYPPLHSHNMNSFTYASDMIADTFVNRQCRWRFFLIPSSVKVKVTVCSDIARHPVGWTAQLCKCQGNGMFWYSAASSRLDSPAM